MARKKTVLFSRQARSEQVTVSFKVPKSIKEKESRINEQLALLDADLKFSLADIAKQAALDAIEEAERELVKMTPSCRQSKPKTEEI